LKGLSLNDVYIPFDDMFEFSAASHQTGLQIFEDLFRLLFEIAFAIDIGISGISLTGSAYVA